MYCSGSTAHKDIIGVCRKMFFLMGAGQNVSDAKAVCRQKKCPHRANFMGAAAPTAPMVSTPMDIYQTLYSSKQHLNCILLTLIIFIY